MKSQAVSRLQRCCLDDLLYLWGHHGAGILHRRDGLVVSAGHGIAANTCHVFEHLDPVFEIAHAATFVMSPGDGNLADDVLQLASDEENLGVEAPTLDGLQAEDDLRGGAL